VALFALVVPLGGWQALGLAAANGFWVAANAQRSYCGFDKC